MSDFAYGNLENACDFHEENRNSTPTNPFDAASNFKILYDFVRFYMILCDFI